LKNPKHRGSPYPRLSIGMPVYNGEKYIREAVDSLLAQSFTDFELIISDNASSDGTEKICRDYAARDDRVQYVRHAKNRGVIHNFQFLLDEVHGEYFMWAAHDDVWDAKWAASLLPVAQRHQCLAYGYVQSIDKNGRKINHPANSQKYEFSGNRFLRRCRYFFAPDFRGKANPIYGIMPLQSLREMGISALNDANSGSDMLFLYDLLNCMEIRHGGEVFLYKRIPCESAAGEIIAEHHDESIVTRATAIIKQAFAGPMLGEYMKRSTLPESLCLLACYPFCVLRSLIFAMFHKARRGLAP